MAWMAIVHAERHISTGATLGIRLLPGVFGDRQRIVAARRTRPSACDTLSRFCARHVLCWFAFLPVPALRSTGSSPVARLCSLASLLLWRDQTSRVRASSASTPRLPDADPRYTPPAKPEISRFPHKERPHMPGS